MDITKEWEQNSNIWLTETVLQMALHEAFPQEKFKIRIKSPNITIMDDTNQQIIISGTQNDPQIELMAEGDNHTLKQAASYLLTNMMKILEAYGDVKQS